MSHREHHSSPSRDKIVSFNGDKTFVKIRCSECLKAVEPIPALTVDHEDYVYHFCSPKCLDKWHSRRATLQGAGSN